MNQKEWSNTKCFYHPGKYSDSREEEGWSCCRKDIHLNFSIRRWRDCQEEINLKEEIHEWMRSQAVSYIEEYNRIMAAKVKNNPIRNHIRNTFQISIQDYQQVIFVNQKQ